MSITHVTPNFSWQEFHCHSGAEVPVEAQPHVRRLCTNVLELVRERFGGPLIVVSGWRSAWHNKAVGGAEQSRHMVGDAADVRTVELAALPRLRSVVEAMLLEGALPALGGIGVYPGWIHMDARPRPSDNPSHVARWFGRGMGSEA